MIVGLARWLAVTCTRRVRIRVRCDLGAEMYSCNHRERAAIDLALARGVSMSALAKRYELGVDSLYRHRRLHLSPSFVRSYWLGIQPR